MKRLLSLLALGLFVSACGGPSSPAIPSAGATSPATTTSASPAPPTAAPPTSEPSSPAPSTPASAGDGVEALISDLTEAGAEVGRPVPFDALPMARNGVSICLDGQTVRVHIYPSPAERMAATAAIDPDDPTNIGTAIVEWMASPSSGNVTGSWSSTSAVTRRQRSC